MASLKSAAPPRKWTEAEDRKLQHEAKIQLNRGSISDWKTIASKIPGRTNKDCRKRWSKISNSIVKGPWETDEDERLQRAVAAHGFRWSQVAEQVRTRNADQCVKRWRHSLDPNVDRSTWKLDEDQRLLDAVAECGRSWTVIAETRFQRRSTTDIKNRYAIIRRRLCQKKATQTPPSPAYAPDSENELDLDSEADEESSNESANADVHDHAAFMDGGADLNTMDFSPVLALTQSDAPFLSTTTPPMSNVFSPSELFFDTPMSQSTTAANGTNADSDIAAFSFLGSPSPAHSNQFIPRSSSAPNMHGNALDGVQDLFDAPRDTISHTANNFAQAAMSASKENARSVKSLTLTLEDVDPDCVSGIVKAVLEMRSARVSMRVDQ